MCKEERVKVGMKLKERLAKLENLRRKETNQHMAILLSFEEIHRFDRLVLLQYWHHHCVSYQMNADEMGLG